MPLYATSMAELQRLAHVSVDVHLCFAGTPLPKAAPGGVQEILRLRQQNTVQATMGLTPIKSAAAFTAPKLETKTSFKKEGFKVNHFATFLRTSSQDATHDSFYPAPGLHQKPVKKGDSSEEYWEISEELSELVRKGEQEHLDDARQAYELTYKRVEKEINGLVGRSFGPATTPGGAIEMAIAELGKRLPTQLGTDPANWVAVLDRLLAMTKKRDTNLWHSIETGEIRYDGTKRIETLRPSTFFQVGAIPSSQVVHL